VTPLPSCIGEAGTTYEPVSVYDWEPRFLEKSFASGWS
jgi:hypothetical protein